MKNFFKKYTTNWRLQHSLSGTEKRPVKNKPEWLPCSPWTMREETSHLRNKESEGFWAPQKCSRLCRTCVDTKEAGHRSFSGNVAGTVCCKCLCTCVHMCKQLENISKILQHKLHIMVKGTKWEGSQCGKSLDRVSKEKQVIGQAWTKLMGKDKERKDDRAGREKATGQITAGKGNVSVS